MQRHLGRARAGRIRRPAVTVLVAVAAGLAASGCRTDPDVAAYVGQETLTEARVDAVVADAQAKATGKEGVKVPTRSDIVMTFVLGRACEVKQAADKFPDPGQPVTPDAVAQSDQVPADSEYARQRAEAYTCLAGAPVGSAVPPSEADIQEIYDKAKAAGLVDRPLADIREQLAADGSVRQAMAVRAMLASLVAGGNVTVNPRYRPLTFTVSDLGTGQPLVVAVIGEDGTGAVRDLS
jgi:hypothetical protein